MCQCRMDGFVEFTYCRILTRLTIVVVIVLVLFGKTVSGSVGWNSIAV